MVSIRKILEKWHRLQLLILAGVLVGHSPASAQTHTIEYGHDIKYNALFRPAEIKHIPQIGPDRFIYPKYHDFEISRTLNVKTGDLFHFNKKIVNSSPVGGSQFLGTLMQINGFLNVNHFKTESSEYKKPGYCGSDPRPHVVIQNWYQSWYYHPTRKIYLFFAVNSKTPRPTVCGDTSQTDVKLTYIGGAETIEIKFE